MSNVFFISDLHLGHKNILSFTNSRQGTNVDEHDEWIIQQWNSVVKPKDLVWVLGDVAFDKKCLPKLKRMRGSKHLILGNHDTFANSDYLTYFNKIYGFTKYKGLWLSHAPIHPDELRGKLCVHGHVHDSTIPDNRYINVCVEALDGVPMSLDYIKETYKNETI